MFGITETYLKCRFRNIIHFFIFQIFNFAQRVHTNRICAAAGRIGGVVLNKILNSVTITGTITVGTPLVGMLPQLITNVHHFRPRKKNVFHWPIHAQVRVQKIPLVLQTFGQGINFYHRFKFFKICQFVGVHNCIL